MTSMTKDTARRAGVGATLCLLLTITAAWSSPLSQGIAWFVLNQEPSGLWASAKGTPFRDAAVTVATLSALNADPAGASAALRAINATAPTSTDYLARQILANRSANAGTDVSALAADLAGRQNTD